VYNYPATGITGVDGEQGTTPLTYALGQNYPNPFNPTTRIAFTLPIASQVELIVYDVLGRQVKTLVNEVQHAGEHFVQWNGTDSFGTSVSSGVYFVRMTAGDFERHEDDAHGNLRAFVQTDCIVESGAGCDPLRVTVHGRCRRRDRREVLRLPPAP
jgi:hypothetical protein